MMARYDIANPAALRSAWSSAAPSRGRSRKRCSMPASRLRTRSLRRSRAKNADFKKVYEAMKAVRGEDYLWFQLAEHTYDTYMMIQQRKGLV